MSALKRVETATGHHPWVKLVTGALLLAGMMAPKQAKAQAVPSTGSVLAQGNDGCHPNRMRDCSSADLKTLIEKGNDMTKANAAVVLARKEDVNDLRFFLNRLDIEAKKGAADAVSGLRNAVIESANLDGAQEARTPMVMTAIEVLKARYNEKNPPANPRAMDQIVGYLIDAIQRVPAAFPQMTEQLVIDAENGTSARGNGTLALALQNLRFALGAPNPDAPGTVIKNRQSGPRPVGQPYN